MNRKKIIILISILAVIITVSYIAISMYNKPHINVAKTAPGVSITSQDLLSDFLTDENQANAAYLDQIVQVTGNITGLDTTDGNAIVTLSHKNSFGSILCHLPLEESEKMISLKEGQKITVKGICTGYLMDVILVKCVLIN